MEYLETFSLDRPMGIVRHSLIVANGTKDPMQVLSAALAGKPFGPLSDCARTARGLALSRRINERGSV
jgi:hypothetical protein